MVSARWYANMPRSGIVESFKLFFQKHEKSVGHVLRLALEWKLPIITKYRKDKAKRWSSTKAVTSHFGLVC